MTTRDEEQHWLTYSYSLLRYCHDAIAGEQLNIGVVVYAPEAGYLLVDFSAHTRRLSCAFRTFSDDHYNAVVKMFRQGITHWQGRISPSALPLEAPPDSLTEILKSIWPDSGLSYRFEEPRIGMCRRSADGKEQDRLLRGELFALFQRFVASQYEVYQRPTRDDDDVWQAYKQSLVKFHATTQLQQREFRIGEFRYPFDHTFKNGAYHVLVPVSLDYADPHYMRDKVTKLKGVAELLHEEANVSRFYFLLGKPSEPANMAAYRQAVNLLAKIRAPHDMVEEGSEENFAKSLADTMRDFGLLNDNYEPVMRASLASSPVGGPPDQ